MEIFNIGLGEMVFIFIIALIVFGPDRLPEIGRQAGRMLREFRKLTAEVTEQVQRELELVEEPVREVRDITTEASAGIQREIESVKEPVREVRQSLASVNREMKGKALPDQEPADNSPDRATPEQTAPTPDETPTTTTADPAATADREGGAEAEDSSPSDLTESARSSATSDGAEVSDATGARHSAANGDTQQIPEPDRPAATPADRLPPSEETTH